MSGRVAHAGQQQNPWTEADIGYVPTGYTITAGGADIGDQADQFRFVYQQITGDVDLIARVSSFQGGDEWSKAGVMVRESLTENSRHTTALLTKAHGFHFLRRIDPGGMTVASAGAPDLPAGWVKLSRRGYTFAAFSSADGVTWSEIGTDTVPMQNTVYVGLAVTAHTDVVTAVVDNFSMTPFGPPNQAPTVAITSPSSGATYTGPATIALTASATDPEGRLSRVEFFNGATSIGLATSAPYSMTWSSVAPGTYSLTAIASDADGATTTSAPVTVTVVTNQPPSIALTAPADGTTYVAPATIGLTATASDPENRLGRVEFYAGGTLLGTDTTAPYAFTWSSVPAGTYVLKAIAYDADGGSATSSTATVAVAADPLTHQDIGAPATAGSASSVSGTYTISAGGVDIYGTSDQGHFVYQAISGDVDIVARVQSIEGGEDWAKAGVMVRESLSAGARNAFALVSRTQGVRFTRRLSTGATTATSGAALGTPAIWLRLVRQGNQFSAYRSTDGVGWTLMGTDTVVMPASVYVGLAVTAHSPSLTTTATIDNLTVQSPTPVNQQVRTYSTNFSLTENPLSEGGQWINGGAIGLDWKNVQTTAGLAFGSDASGNPSYNDPTAIVGGTWGPDQTAQATVYTVNQQSGSVYEEVELRLRSTISAHWNSGYEINFRCTRDGSQYTEIVRWNGPLGNFTYLARAQGPGLANGDVVKATMIGNVITVYINGVQVNQAVDNTFTSGNPGIGFYLHNAPNRNADFGFTSFYATDGSQ